MGLDFHFTETTSNALKWRLTVYKSRKVSMCKRIRRLCTTSVLVCRVAIGRFIYLASVPINVNCLIRFERCQFQQNILERIVFLAFLMHQREF